MNVPIYSAMFSNSTKQMPSYSADIRAIIKKHFYGKIHPETPLHPMAMPLTHKNAQVPFACTSMLWHNDMFLC